MKLFPLKSDRFEAGTNLESELLKSLLRGKMKLKSGDILVIASKVVSYSQGLLRKIQPGQGFRDLVEKEADQVLYEWNMSLSLTLKNRILIPNAGIDKSNAPEGYAILWPQKPFEVARSLRTTLMEEFGLKELGVLISDSGLQPLRQGTTGIAIGWAGFEGVSDERGKADLHGQAMVFTQIAVADDLASAANLLMGETNAMIPFVVIRDFQARYTEKEFEESDYFMPLDQCLYASIMKLN